LPIVDGAVVHKDELHVSGDLLIARCADIWAALQATGAFDWLG
jgi:hypothetical protein